jgi:penicillin-binding protein A
MSPDPENNLEEHPRSTNYTRLLLVPPFLLLVVLLIYGVFFIQLRKADHRTLTGEYAQALDTLHQWKWLPLMNGRVFERIGTAELLHRGKKEAAPHLIQAEAAAFWRPVPFWQEALKILWTQARYDDGLSYAQHLEKGSEDQSILYFYKAGFHAGLNQLTQAEQDLARTGSIPEWNNEKEALHREILRRKATGQYPLLYDRENLPLVSRSAQGDIKVLYDSVRPLLKNPSGDYLAQFRNRPGRQVTTTLDYRMQTAALQALQRYAGAIVLLDVENGDILAAAGNLQGFNSNHSPETSVALHTQYEPGSIIKMITLAGSLETQMNPQKLFPMQCEGSLPLSGGKIFYCWKGRHSMNDFDVATAVSCNVAFAKMGLAMKTEQVVSNLRKFGFDASLSRAYLPLELGKIIPGEKSDEYVANLSIGLNYLTITPLHAAMIAAAIANEGVSMTPRLLLHYRNITGLPYSASNPVPFGTFLSRETAVTLTKSMEQVVLHPEGTGKRAAVEGLPIAMKTGTAGEGAKGYTPILIGFAPVRAPKVAFAVVVEHAGKAEYEGARITKLFLESIRGYIQ